MMDLGLSGKKVLITGATQGIGLATAKGFLDEGAEVYINGHNEERLQKVYSGLNVEYPTNVIPCYGDVTSMDSIDSMIRSMKKKIQHLDIAVMNVGTGKSLSENDLDVKEWQRFYEVNTISSVGMLNKLYPLLKKSNDANVILISSIIAKERAVAPMGYAAAKAGVLELNRYLSAKWAEDNIRVNTILPGNIFFQGGRWEELIANDESGIRKYIKDNVPLKRFGRPDEVAAAILFLSSKQAGFITGATLTVDGGQQRAV